MIIKKYIADTISEALNMIKLELGPEAIIVSRRNVKRKGIMGSFLPKRLEITAAIDDYIKKEPEKVERVEPVRDIESKTEGANELNEVKEMLQKLVDDKEKDAKKEKKTGIRKLLLERDVSEDVITFLSSSARKKEKYKSAARLPDSALIDEIKDIITVSNVNDGRIHVFIGPTGVGKTTTIAKIAALEALNTRKKVGLITIDTYRIGAVEQLKIYADILGLPFEVINNMDDVERSMNNLKDCDSIFIDTTGRSIKNVMQLSEIKFYLDRIKPDIIYLAISMTTKYHDMLQIIKGFSTMDYNRIVLTKFDETTTYGSLLNVACNTKVPLCYITIGQNVPDDIKVADKDKLLDLVIGEGSI